MYSFSRSHERPVYSRVPQGCAYIQFGCVLRKKHGAFGMCTCSAPQTALARHKHPARSMHAEKLLDKQLYNVIRYAACSGNGCARQQACMKIWGVRPGQQGCSAKGIRAAPKHTTLGAALTHSDSAWRIPCAQSGR